MARRKKNMRKPLSRFLAPFMAFLLISTFIISIYIILRPAESIPQPASDNSISKCKEGMSQFCSVGGCSGISECINGKWSVCSWEKICISGSHAPCLDNGCFYGYKTCNFCGTAYGECPELEK